MACSWASGTVRADHADTAVEFADFWGEHDLDFSPASLSRLDDLVDAEWDDERFAETTFGSDASFDDRAFSSSCENSAATSAKSSSGTSMATGRRDGPRSGRRRRWAGRAVRSPVVKVAISSLRKQAVLAGETPPCSQSWFSRHEQRDDGVPVRRFPAVASQTGGGQLDAHSRDRFDLIRVESRFTLAELVGGLVVREGGRGLFTNPSTFRPSHTGNPLCPSLSTMRFATSARTESREDVSHSRHPPQTLITVRLIELELSALRLCSLGSLSLR